VRGEDAAGRAQLALRFGCAADGGTALLARHVEWPWSLPRGYRRAGVTGPLTVLPQCAGAALLPGDHWRHHVTLQPGARVDLVSAGALLVHADRAAPRPARSDWAFHVAAGAVLRQMPDPTVLMPGAQLAQEVELCLEPGAVAILFDGFCRQTPTAPVAGGGWHSALRVTDPAGRVLLHDRQVVDEAGLIALAALPGRAAAFGSVTLFGRDDLAEGPLDLPGAFAAAARLRGGLGTAIRIAAESGGALDRAFRLLRDRLA